MNNVKVNPGETHDRVRTVKKGDLEARVATLEKDLARVLALAEGAQRAAFRVNCRLEDMAAGLSRAANLDLDPYGVPAAFDDGIYGEEDARAARVIRGEPAEDPKSHKTV